MIGKSFSNCFQLDPEEWKSVIFFIIGKLHFEKIKVLRLFIAFIIIIRNLEIRFFWGCLGIVKLKLRNFFVNKRERDFILITCKGSLKISLFFSVAVALFYFLWVLMTLNLAYVILQLLRFPKWVIATLQGCN